MNTLTPENINAFWHVIEESDSILVTTHVNPDGDAIGSELALYRFLKGRGKGAFIINHSPVPFVYQFMDPEAKLIKQYDAADDERIMKCDTVIVCDLSTMERLGSISAVVSNCPAKKMCIDHHTSNQGLGDVNLVDVSAAATGEIIYGLIKDQNGTITSDIACDIYIAILTDTGSFRFSNTTPKAHRITADLLAQGLDPRKLYESVYEMSSWERIYLFSKGIASIQKAAEGRIAWMSLTYEAMEEVGARREDVEGFVEFLSTIGGVQVMVLLYEYRKGIVKISLRSKGNFDVNQFAGKFGGGGHTHAAGILVQDSTIAETTSTIISALEETLWKSP